MLFRVAGSGCCNCLNEFLVAATVRLLLELFVGLGHALNVQFEANCVASRQDSHLRWLLLCHCCGFCDRRCCRCDLLRAQLACVHVLCCFVFERAEDVGGHCVTAEWLVSNAASVFARPSGASGELAGVSTLVCQCLEQVVIDRDGVLRDVTDATLDTALLLLAKCVVIWLWLQSLLLVVAAAAVEG